MSSGTEPSPGFPAAGIHASPTLILGLGNPILRDDRVGLIVARRLFERIPPGAAILQEASVGGVELLHVLEGHEQVLIIDAQEPGKLAPGQVQELEVADLRSNHPPLVLHQLGLATCLELGRRLGLHMPVFVRVFAIGVCDPYTFSESCTEEVERAIPGIVDAIAAAAFGPEGQFRSNRA